MFKIILDILVIGLFLYSKLLPYKDRLHSKYKRIFSFFDKLFNPILFFLKKYIKPFEVGQSISIDMSQIFLLTLFLLLMSI